MSLYKVPFDFSHEEKVFGGYLSLRQMLYLIATVISVGIMFAHIPLTIKAIMFLIIVSIFMVFAFVKIGNTYADKYFVDILRYVFRKKIYIMER